MRPISALFQNDFFLKPWTKSFKAPLEHVSFRPENIRIKIPSSYLMESDSQDCREVMYKEIKNRILFSNAAHLQHENFSGLPIYAHVNKRKCLY